ncbi:MAG: hypothetical protein DRH04_07295 [Deltaproteobacteria bacterium]|nr:MAG: hypothetical protein DRH04_07295 [Deltaproteobacteria bacterium]
MRREFLQLAKKFNPKKHSPEGMFASEKLDGTRVFWDGGITRGVPTEQVPWANIIDPKTGGRKKKIKPLATGLWSRYGNPIIAPDWWLNRLPQMFLDGELFAGRGKFQTLRSIVAKDVADSEAWREVQFAVFSTPAVSSVFTPGEIKNTNFHLTVDPVAIKTFMMNRTNAGVTEEFIHTPGGLTFDQEIKLLEAMLPHDDLIYLHQQYRLPNHPKAAKQELEIFMDHVLQEGGEGIILRDPKSLWTPKRVASILKLKPFLDDAGVVTGFVSGRQTDKGSKLRGLIGAVVLNYNGKRLELSGFTDEERKFSTEEEAKFAWENPGEQMPSNFQGKHFKVGDTVEFRYRELSDDGIPKEARYARKV